MSEWKSIEKAPKDGTLLDLIVKGEESLCKFYACNAKKIKGTNLWQGRCPNHLWFHKPPNNPNWYSPEGLGYPISPDLEVTHFMEVPQLPEVKS